MSKHKKPRSAKSRGAPFKTQTNLQQPTKDFQPSEPLKILHNVVAGIDVHKSILVACVLKHKDGKDTYQVRQFGVFKKDVHEIGEWFLEHNVELVAMESTSTYWRSPFDLLTAAGLKVILVNAHRVKHLPGHKSDVEDSRWLALLARCGLLQPSRILPKDEDQLRELTRLRQKFIEDLAAHKNRVIKLLTKEGFNLANVVSDVFGKTGMFVVKQVMDGVAPEVILEKLQKAIGYRLKASKEMLKDSLGGKMTELLRFELQTLLNTINYLVKTIQEMEAKIEETMIASGQGPKIDLLETLPGVSRMSAMILLAELGCNLGDFKSGKHLSSWVGICPGNNESAGKRRSGRINNGNAYLKRILCEIAQATTRTECYFQERHKNLAGRRGYKRAIVATGHKILKIAFHMLTNNELYKDRLVDYEALVTKRNAPRWIKQMAKHNCLNVSVKKN
jgi:transposase